MLNPGKVRRNRLNDARYGAFLSYRKLKEFIAPKRIKSKAAYHAYVRRKHALGQCLYLPVMPHRTYKFEWEGWREFLGGISMCSYEHARMLAHKHNVYSTKMWALMYKKIAPAPYKLPSNPRSYYKDRWEGADIFFAARPAHVIQAQRKQKSDHLKSIYEKRAPKATRWAKMKREFRPYIEACKFIAQFQLKDWEDYRKWRKNYRGEDMPWRPWETYKDSWTSWTEFLGKDPGVSALHETSVVYIIQHPNDPINVGYVGIDKFGASNVKHICRQSGMSITFCMNMVWQNHATVQQVIDTYCRQWSDGKRLIADVYGLTDELAKALRV